MKKYNCHKCDSVKELDPRDYKRSNLKSWCFCTPDTPTRLSDIPRAELDNKYKNIFKTKTLCSK